MSSQSDPSSASYPLAAQLPLQTFTLPTFPPEASRLRSLTLTSDIKLDEYQSLVAPASNDKNSFAVSNSLQLPESITDLTLELFTLGFPPQFLTHLSKSLPRLQSLTLFSCLIDGLGEESRADAVTFFESLPALKEVHVIDTFARPGFWSQIGKIARGNAPQVDSATREGDDGGRGLKLVEISFTYRGHEEEDFLSRVGGEELATLLVPGVVGWHATFLPASMPDVESADDSLKAKQETTPKGILPFASDGRASAAMRERFTESSGKLTEMRVLDLSMYTLKTTELGELIACCKDTTNNNNKTQLLNLTVSVLMEEGWFEGLLGQLSGKCPSLEALEVIGVPNVRKDQTGPEKTLAPGQGGATNLVRQTLPALKRLDMNILKAQDIVRLQWVDDPGENGGEWQAVRTP